MWSLSLKDETMKAVSCNYAFSLCKKGASLIHSLAVGLVDWLTHKLRLHCACCCRQAFGVRGTATLTTGT